MKTANVVRSVAVVAALMMAANDASAKSFASVAKKVSLGNSTSVDCPPPVPEAGTWAMMGIGLVTLGAIARRRKAGSN